MVQTVCEQFFVRRVHGNHHGRVTVSVRVEFVRGSTGFVVEVEWVSLIVDSIVENVRMSLQKLGDAWGERVFAIIINTHGNLVGQSGCVVRCRE